MARNQINATQVHQLLLGTIWFAMTEAANAASKAKCLGRHSLLSVVT